MLTSLVYLQQGKYQKLRKSLKIVNIVGENLCIFWTTWWVSMTFPRKMWLIILLKVTKKQDFPSFSNTHFSKNQIVHSPSLFRANGTATVSCSRISFAAAAHPINFVLYLKDLKLLVFAIALSESSASLLNKIINYLLCQSNSSFILTNYTSA